MKEGGNDSGATDVCLRLSHSRPVGLLHRVWSGSLSSRDCRARLPCLALAPWAGVKASLDSVDAIYLIP